MSRRLVAVVGLGVLGGLLYLASLAVPAAMAQSVRTDSAPWIGSYANQGGDVSFGAITATSVVSTAHAIEIGSGGTFFSSAALPESQNMTAYRPLGGTVYARNLTCGWTAGTGGSVGVKIVVRNITDSSDLGSCTFSCTGSGGTCDINAALVTAKTYGLRVDSATDCATNPTVATCGLGLAR